MIVSMQTVMSMALGIIGEKGLIEVSTYRRTVQLNYIHEYYIFTGTFLSVNRLEAYATIPCDYSPSTLWWPYLTNESVQILSQ